MDLLEAYKAKCQEQGITDGEAPAPEPSTPEQHHTNMDVVEQAAELIGTFIGLTGDQKVGSPLPPPVLPAVASNGTTDWPFGMTEYQDGTRRIRIRLPEWIKLRTGDLTVITDNDGRRVSYPVP